jgi:hypothetical protein
LAASLPHAEGRTLTAAEIELLSVVMRPFPKLLHDIRAQRVVDMNDGGMGSIKFLRTDERLFGRALAEAEYVDQDGVTVSIAFNLDKNGDLFEVDFWKVDFSSLSTYPKSDQLTIKYNKDN